jgi:hypothetical protein
MSGKLEGKIAVITGGSSGIGLAAAQAFVREGAHVFITARRQAELEKAKALIGGKVTAVQGDIADLADLDRLYETVRPYLLRAGHALRPHRPSGGDGRGHPVPGFRREQLFDGHRPCRRRRPDPSVKRRGASRAEASSSCATNREHTRPERPSA